MLVLLVTYKGVSEINDACPASWSKALVRMWARQRLEAGVTVTVVSNVTGAVVFEETCA